jgi:hypothetical protein
MDDAESALSKKVRQTQNASSLVEMFLRVRGAIIFGNYR